MLPKNKIVSIIKQLNKKYPMVKCALRHRSAFELLAATILSAQCTDVQVNKVTPALFKRYGTPERMAAAPINKLEELIRSTGFYRNKAKHLKAMADRLLKRFGGQVPSTMQDLISLPGVARKTANVVLGDWFKKSEGIVVDTHVKRVSRLLGLTSFDQPEQIEQDLIQMVPQKEWMGFSHRLILHGRETCIARRPRCAECILKNYCPSNFLREAG